MNEFYVPLTTENQMSVEDIIRECHKEKWAPVVVIKYENRTVVPVFRNHDTAMKFIFRNFGKSVKPTSGTIGIDKVDFDIFTNKGWEVEILDFPRKFTNLASLEIETIDMPDGFHLPNQGVW